MPNLPYTLAILILAGMCWALYRRLQVVEDLMRILLGKLAQNGYLAPLHDEEDSL